MENRKTNARTIEFQPTIAAGGETAIRYTVHQAINAFPENGIGQHTFDLVT